jgi:hypothetical protein
MAVSVLDYGSFSNYLTNVKFTMAVSVLDYENTRSCSTVKSLIFAGILFCVFVILCLSRLWKGCNRKPFKYFQITT